MKQWASLPARASCGVSLRVGAAAQIGAQIFQGTFRWIIPNGHFALCR